MWAKFLVVTAAAAAACCVCCRGETELSGVWAKFLVLGLGLLFLGKQEVVEPTLEVRAKLFFLDN